MNRIQHALGGVTASEELKARTRSYLSAARAGSGRRRSGGGRLALCACALLAALGLGGWRLYAAPVSYISIDVNPSVELALNRLDRVVGITAYNDAGGAVALGLSLQNQTYQQAIDTLLSDGQFRSYLTEESALVFTVVSDHAGRIRRGIESRAGYQDNNGKCMQADRSCLEEAHAYGLSVGKYRAFLELAQYDNALTVDDCHGMTMGEIQQQLEDCQGHAPSSGGDSGHGHHGHGGHSG